VTHAKWLAVALLLCSAIGATLVLAEDDDEVEGAGPTILNKNGFEIDERSIGKVMADETLSAGGVLQMDPVSPVPGLDPLPQVQLRGGNVQVNDPALDNVQIFPGFRPFISYTQSETSVASFGRNIVATYNTSANQPLVPAGPGSLAFVRRFLSGFSTSHDGGQTWTSGFMPPVPGSIFTFGDPSVDVDRVGNFYFAGLGADAAGHATIQVNASHDGGSTWTDAVVVQQDNGGDKEWLAVGRDPLIGNRDNVYVTWTSFQTTGAQLRFARSIDGGVTWETKTIFAPPTNANAELPQNSLQFSAPTVDPIDGTLYVPFVQFSNADEDFIRILKSTDAGDTFSFVNFNVPGAPLPDVLPIVQAGHLIDMGSGGIRLGVHAGPSRPGRFGLRQYFYASRLIPEPSLQARNGALYLAWPNSTSAAFGDPASGSNMLLVRSLDGGNTWSSPVTVNPIVAGDGQHVLGALTIGSSPMDVSVAYYTQHADGTLDVDLASSHDRGATFASNRAIRVSSTNFALPPTVVPLSGACTVLPPPQTSCPTTNYDRLIQPGYALGEYLSVRSANGMVAVLWGDTRNSVQHPINPLDPLSGVTHAQEDVMFQKVKAP